MMTAHPLPKIIELEVGQSIGTQEILLTRDSLVRYAGASGDFNPIHYRDDIAASVGLPGVLAHGMLTMGAAVQVVVDWVGDSGRIVDYGVRFTKPVVVDPADGAVLVISGKIGEIDTEAQSVRIDLSTVYNEQTVLAKAQVDGQPVALAVPLMEPLGLLRAAMEADAPRKAPGVRDATTDRTAVRAAARDRLENIDCVGEADRAIDLYRRALGRVFGGVQYETVLAYRYHGRRFDCGSMLGYLQASVEIGLQHAETGAAFADWLAKRG